MKKLSKFKFLFALVSVALIVAQLAPSISYASAASDTKEVTTTYLNGSKLETVEERDDYAKLKITNLESGKTEYIESFLEKGEYSYKVTSDDESYLISALDNEIKITNLNTNTTEYIPLEVIDAPEYAINGDNTDGYKWIRTISTSTKIQGATEAVIISILSALAKFPAVVTIIIAAAGYYKTVNAKNAYLRIAYYQKVKGSTFYEKQLTHFYKHSNYTGFIGTTTKITTTPIRPR